jgi:hypothetical protein
MNPIHDRRIGHPAAWTSAEIGGKEGLVHRMGPEHQQAIFGLVEQTRHLAPDAVTRQDFDHPLVNDLMKSLRFEIMNGRGAVILAGLDMTGVSEEDYGRIYYGLGTHLGRAAIQSPKRDLIGRVEKVEDNPERRGYQLDVELRSHTDFHEILSLASYRKAAAGGESGMVSSLALHNVMLEEAPEQLKALYEGWWHGYAEKQHLTAEKVPIFCNVDGQVSCYYHALSFLAAARVLETELPDELRQAMAAFSAIAQRPAIRADFMLEPGEMLFWHNFLMLHSRQSFTDEGAAKRLLLRLWLHVDGGRPMHPEFLDRARLMDELHERGQTALQYRPFVAPRATPGKTLAAVRA